jgi:addiction module HigA family antidote
MVSFIDFDVSDVEGRICRCPLRGQWQDMFCPTALRTVRQTTYFFSVVAKGKNMKMKPIPPGEILLEDFMKPRKLSVDNLAVEIQVSAEELRGIVEGSRAITEDMALRLGRFFGVSPEIWTGIQVDYENRTSGDKIAKALQNQEVDPLGVQRFRK